MVSKAKKSKNNRSLLKNLGHRIKDLSLGVKILSLVIIAVVSFVAYRQTAIYLEKRDILAKQQKLEELADKIASQYPPDSRNNDQYCRYQSQKLSKGGRSCNVSYKLMYEGLSLENANIKKNEISSINKNVKLSNNFSSKNIEFDSNDFSTTEGYIHQDLQKNDLGGCYVSYSYMDMNGKLSVLTIDLSCSLSAKSDYFPVRK